MDRDKLTALTSKLGVEFLAYASNVTVDDLNGMLGTAPLTAAVNVAVFELQTLIDSQLPATPETPEGGVIDVSGHLDMLNLGMLMGFQHQGNSIANAVRLIVGGQLPGATFPDTLEQQLAILARDLYPLLLLPRDDKDGFPDFMNISSMLSPSMYRNEYAAFFDAIEADTILGSLYVSKGNGNGQDRYFKNFNYWLNTGSGTGQQLISLPTELIVPAYYKNQIEGKSDPEDFIAQVVENLKLFKKLADKETVEVPAYVAINGVSLPEGISLDLPWGTLRTPTSTELELLAPRSQMINAVLVVPFKLRMKTMKNFFGGTYPFMNDGAREKIEEAAMLTSASIMVGLGKEVRTDSVGTIILPTFGHSPATSWSFEKPGSVVHELKLSERNKVSQTAVIIEDHKKRLSIALKRNLMAINRLDTLDGFIDSIISMESLFGSMTETTFTISSAMAKFLRTSMEDRLALKKEIGQLYGERSKIIHGASFPSAQVIETKRQRVIDLNIEVLRKLIYKRIDLIDLASNERSAKILLK